VPLRKINLVRTYELVIRNYELVIRNRNYELNLFFWVALTDHRNRPIYSLSPAAWCVVEGVVSCNRIFEY